MVVAAGRGPVIGEAGAEARAGRRRGAEDEADRLRRIDWLAGLMDDRFRLPGTDIRFGWDAVVGLLPGIGDTASTAVSLLILHHAWQTDMPASLKARMIGNVVLDFVLGALPLVGDLFDVAFKANRRNARLLRQHLQRRSGA